MRTLRLTIPDDVVAVAARAKSEGVTTSEYVIRVLSKELSPPTSADVRGATERDDLSILEEAGSAAQPSRVWLGGAVAAVLLVALTMAVLAVVVFVLWGASLLFSWLGIPRLPGPMF